MPYWKICVFYFRLSTLRQLFISASNTKILVFNKDSCLAVRGMFWAKKLSGDLLKLLCLKWTRQTLAAILQAVCAFPAPKDTKMSIWVLFYISTFIIHWFSIVKPIVIVLKGSCLENVNVTAGDSRDENKIERFLPLSLNDMIKYPTDTFLQQWAFYPIRQVGTFILINTEKRYINFCLRVWDVSIVIWLTDTLLASSPGYGVLFTLRSFFPLCQRVWA